MRKLSPTVWRAGLCVAVLAALPQQARYIILCAIGRPLIGQGGIIAATQLIDGHPYGPAFSNPPREVALARSYTWGADDLIIATHPKSGTHFTMLAALLVLYRGQLPAKTDLHSLIVLPEFSKGGASARSRPYDEPPDYYATHPRVITTHMPVHHLHYSAEAKYVYVMRDPVAGISSGRRMELLILGPYLTPTLDVFVREAAAGCVRSGGWLDQVLAWWQARSRPNQLVLKYEWMLAHPRRVAQRLARLVGISLSASQVNLRGRSRSNASQATPVLKVVHPSC